ncbi:MAG: DUF554 domain-containing protein [Anaerolineae bacterium]|nr:DUF554 domain-containing protein [Anaerolineae bacterium]
MMGGTILNTITVLIGSTVGLLIGNRLPQRIQESVITGLGLVTLFVGLSNTNETGNIIIPLLSLITGVIIGELLNIDARLEAFAGWLQRRVAGVGGSADKTPADSAEAGTGDVPADPRARFIQGFVTASLVFCVGPLTFVGSIQDGMGLDSGFEQLAIKSTLDGFASMAFAASLGIGVLFSVITVFGVQGGLALAGWLAGEFMSDAMINEMTAVGGLLLIGLSLVLLDLKKPRVANFLPALLVAPVLVAVAEALGINIYPL